MSTDSVTPGIRSLCPTRWTVRADSLSAIISNYSILQSTWDNALHVARDTESKARIHGVSSQMTTFDYYFGTLLGELVLRHSDNLSRTLQHKSISAAEGQHVAAMVVNTIESMRTEESYQLFWDKVLLSIESLDIEQPQLPRRRRTPKRYDDGLASPEFHESPMLYYRQYYYEAIDLIVNCIKKRFDQPDYHVYCQLEMLLVNACQKKDFTSELDAVCKFFKDDLNQDQLQAQLLTLSVNFPDNAAPNLNILDIKEHFLSLSSGQRILLDQVNQLLKLILVMPATNATSERSFSTLRRVKNYLRSTMTQQRLNSLMILHVHKLQTDSLNLVEVANDFIGDSEHRLKLFGKF